MIRTLRRPIVVGASLGGFALMLALEELAAAVAGLVLVDVIPAPDPGRTRAYLAPRGNLSAWPLIEDILARSEDLSRIVADLRLPILLVSGGARSPIGEKGRGDFAALVPHAKIAIIERASHLVARDAPDRLAELIVDFGVEAEVIARRASRSQI